MKKIINIAFNVSMVLLFGSALLCVVLVWCENLGLSIDKNVFTRLFMFVITDVLFFILLLLAKD